MQQRPLRAAPRHPFAQGGQCGLVQRHGPAGDELAGGTSSQLPWLAESQMQSSSRSSSSPSRMSVSRSPVSPVRASGSTSSLVAASRLGDALNAVAAAAHAAITGYGVGPAELWPLLGRFGLARHLTPVGAD